MGDHLLGIEGRKIFMPSDLTKALRGKKRGQRLKLAISRQGWSRTIELKLD